MNSLEPPKFLEPLEFMEPQEPMEFLEPPESKELPCPWSQWMSILSSWSTRVLGAIRVLGASWVLGANEDNMATRISKLKNRFNAFQMQLFWLSHPRNTTLWYWVDNRKEWKATSEEFESNQTPFPTAFQVILSRSYLIFEVCIPGRIYWPPSVWGVSMTECGHLSLRTLLLTSILECVLCQQYIKVQSLTSFHWITIMPHILRISSLMNNMRSQKLKSYADTKDFCLALLLKSIYCIDNHIVQFKYKV